jgi:putative SOS response-associated peptidase YedK
MCKAYTLTKTAEEIIRTFELVGGDDVKPAYNIRPSQLVPVILQGSEPGLSFFYWGATPAFAQNKTLAEKLYNTRTEAIAGSVGYQAALKKRKCLIPADGFYAWRKISKNGLVPYHYFLDQNKLFSFAGLWQEFEEIDGQQAHTFSLLTTPANNLVSQSEARMPIIFEPNTGLQWLKAGDQEALAMLSAFPDDQMAGFAVSTRVNNPQNNDPELIAPAPPADQFGNYSLFD